MSTPLETWLKIAEHYQDECCEMPGDITNQAVAIIKKLKEALYTGHNKTCNCNHCAALAIDTDSLLRNSNKGD